MRVLIAPQKISTTDSQKRRGFEVIRGLNPRVGSLTEMYGHSGDDIRLLENTLGKRFTVHYERLVNHPHSLEVPILLRMFMAKVVLFEAFPLSHDIKDDTGFGNDRVLYKLVFRLRWSGKTFAYFATHTKAVVQVLDSHKDNYGDFMHNDRWEATKDDMALIEHKLAECVVDSDIDGVMIGADWNIMPIGEGLSHPRSPFMMFKRLGMTYVNERVVALAWTQDAFTLTSKKVIPAGQQGNPADHAWLLAGLRPVSRRKRRSRIS